MSAKPMKEGWVEKRSRYLKQWRKRYLVLTKDSISTFKQSSQERATLFIALYEILSVVPFSFKTPQDFYFKLRTANQEVLIKAPNDEEMCGWLNQINICRKEYSLASLPRLEKYSELQKNTESSIRELFRNVLETIIKREQEVLREFEDSYTLQAANYCTELQNTQRALEKEKKNFAEISSIQTNSFMDKLQKINNLHNNHESSANNFNQISLLSMSIQPEEIKKICDSNVRVFTVDPNEYSVRRACVTRALKWTYAHDRIDAISFSTSQNIKLNGIGVCAPYKPGKLTSAKFVKVLKGGRTDSPCIYSHAQKVEIGFQKDQSVFKITLKPSLAIKKDTIYTVSLCLQGSSTYKCLDCLDEVQGPSDVLWRFTDSNIAPQHYSNRCSAMRGPIAEFFYSS